MAKPRTLTIKLNYFFMLKDCTTGITYEQDRSDPSFAEFLADMALGHDDIDWQNSYASRAEYETDNLLVLTDEQFHDALIRAAKVLDQRSWENQMARNMLEAATE